MDEVREWQARPLDAVYPVVIFDALRIKIRGEGLVRIRRFTRPWASTWKGSKRSWGFGWSRPKGPNSGCG